MHGLQLVGDLLWDHRPPLAVGVLGEDERFTFHVNLFN